MPTEGLPGMHERISKTELELVAMEKEFRREIREVKKEIALTNEKVSDIKSDQNLDRQKISSMEMQLNKIDDNTTYTRRQMTGILVGAVATGIIGGAITLIYAMIGGGII